MTNLVILIPVALLLGAAGLAAFLWALRSGQYEDLDGAAARVLLEEEGTRPRESEPPGSATAGPRRRWPRDSDARRG